MPRLLLLCGVLSALGFSQPTLSWPVVFVSRAIPANGTVYWSVPNSLPGVGPYSRYQVAAPGRLLVREPNGTIRTLVDGSQPSTNAYQLIDVSAPTVSFDGQWVAFSGLPSGSYPTGPREDLDAWRLYKIRADGTSLTQVTFDQAPLDLSRFGWFASSMDGHDDTDPCFLPDGRIVFSSTRYPAKAQYGGVRTTNLFVVDANGMNLRRITTERSGADRPLVDPLTGHIVFSRWWRNYRVATEDPSTSTNGSTIYRQIGLAGENGGGMTFLARNTWLAASIRPDGTELKKWSSVDVTGGIAYGGSFTPNGDLVSNFFPINHVTESAGFGGLRLVPRGAGRHIGLLGVTEDNQNYVYNNPPSYGVTTAPYWAEPCVLPDGRILASRAPNHFQDYGLWIANANGSNPELLLDWVGTGETRAALLIPRTLPPILPDTISAVAPPLPPYATGPYDTSGTFLFDDLNVFANGPVDLEIPNAPGVGQAATIRFFLDHQRTSSGSFPGQDWPILLGEKAIEPTGRVTEFAPADVPLFEQLRSSSWTVPLTEAYGQDGAAHVTGHNYARPGAIVRCVGCHSGHSLLDVPATAAEAAWTNLATGASVTASSAQTAEQPRAVIDRRVHRIPPWTQWRTQTGQTQNQWIRLTFPVPITARSVRLWNLALGGDASSTVQVHQARVRLFATPGAALPVLELPTGALSSSGTELPFPPIVIQELSVHLDSVSGTSYGSAVAGLGEIEVIASADTGSPPSVEPYGHSPGSPQSLGIAYLVGPAFDEIRAMNAPPLALGALLIGPTPADFLHASHRILVAPDAPLIPFSFDSVGVAHIPIAHDPALLGLTGYAQAFAVLPGSPPTVSSSPGLMKRF